MAGTMSGRGLLAILARLMAAFVWSRVGSQRLITFLAKPRQQDLIVMQDLMKAGKVKPVIDKCYGLSEVHWLRNEVSSRSETALGSRALKAPQDCLGGREKRNLPRSSIDHSRGKGTIDDAKYPRRRSISINRIGL